MNIDTTEKVVIFGHSTCPNVGPVKGLLKLSKIEFEYVDIHKDREAAETVRNLNNGNESVPTLIFPDGSKLTEPSIKILIAKLKSYGYKIGGAAWLIGNIWTIVVYVGIIYALARFFGLL